MRCFWFVLAMTAGLSSCSRRLDWQREFSAVEVKFKDNTGFVLYDPDSRKTLIHYNEAKYFTPASNTKILTLYTSLRILGDSVPALRYIVRHDSMIVWGTGDPSFLYKEIQNNSRTFKFLQNSPQRLFVSTGNFETDHWGSGWMWDDYPYAFSAEKSPFPIYGNLAKVKFISGNFVLAPRFFQNHFVTSDTVAGDAKLLREIDSNLITFTPGRNLLRRTEWDVPFHCSSDLIAELLSDTLLRQVDEILLKKPVTGVQTIFSIPTDTLYAVMMKNSDNFIAEQLLLLCSEKISDTLNPDIAIRYARKNLIADLPDEPVWVDGSGLSRYNLTTPRNLVRLWEKLYRNIPRDRLFTLLSIGGRKGTLKSSYVAEPPFIFGKTGSFSNNSSLSGFLITKTGRTLIFCFLNGNFVAPQAEVRKMMETMLTRIRDNY